jgi:hypothetical protein
MHAIGVAGAGLILVGGVGYVMGVDKAVDPGSATSRRAFTVFL